jgi:hypothetical protein
MPWLGIWFEHFAGDGGPRSPERFQSLVPPIIYPYAHGFLEDEEKRLLRSRDPGTYLREGTRYRVYYSIAHDGGQTGLTEQGCRILNWLFRHFIPDSGSTVSSRFSEIPVVIHAEDPAKAAAMGNALTLLRFLAAAEDQAVARILIHPWNFLRGSPATAAAEYERRVLEFLHGEVFYPADVTLFDVLDRADLKAHRDLGPCCLTQIGFIAPLLEWIDECRPETDAERVELFGKLRNSLADEAKYLSRKGPPRVGGV